MRRTASLNNSSMTLLQHARLELEIDKEIDAAAARHRLEHPVIVEVAERPLGIGHVDAARRVERDARGEALAEHPEADDQVGDDQVGAGARGCARRRTTAGIRDSARYRRPARTAARAYRGARRCSAWVGIAQAQARAASAAARAALQPGEIVAGVIGRAGQRRGRHHQKPLAERLPAIGLELVRGDEAGDRVMLRRRLQILADGQEIDLAPRADRPSPAAPRPCSSPSPTMMPDLVNIAGSMRFDLVEQPQRGEIARARPHLGIKPRHGFEIVVEDVGPGRDRPSRSRRPCAGNRGPAPRSSCRARRRGSPRWCGRNGRRRHRRDRRGRPR